MNEVITEPTTLIESLQNPERFDHPVTEFKVIETHISLVLLTGRYAYKIKKPVNFGFLDFSTLEKRHFYCQEELRLNRRLAPRLYLAVIPINGSQEQPVLNGQGPAIEYAVKMVQFPQSAQLDRKLELHGLDYSIMDKLAQKVAHFHDSIEPATNNSIYGNSEQIQQPVLENFHHIRTSLMANSIEEGIAAQLDKLEHWSKQQLHELHDAFHQRKMQGFIRECHGDMHLRNIALWEDEILIFDCIEFNKSFYWIDVISEIAFLVMDLEDRNQDAFAQRFLNQYLELTGDFTGLHLLRFYKVYRALVRAKVDALRLTQETKDSQEYEQTLKDFQQYLTLAERYIRHAEPCLLINHGLSGSGKTFNTRVILEKYPAIQIRSDVERKRLFQKEINITGVTDVEQGIYTADATEKTYARLLEVAQVLLTSGYSVVVDAANLKQQQRELFIDLAKSLRIPYFILDFQASVETLKQRVIQRAQDGNDVSDASQEVLQHQIASHDPLTADEETFTIKINTEQTIDIANILDRIHTTANKPYSA